MNVPDRQDSVDPQLLSESIYWDLEYGFCPEFRLYGILVDLIRLFKATYQIELDVVSQHFALKSTHPRKGIRARNAVRNKTKYICISSCMIR